MRTKREQSDNYETPHKEGNLALDLTVSPGKGSHSKILRKPCYYNTFLATPVGSEPVYNEKIVFPFLQFQFSINSRPENGRARRHM